MKPAGDSNSLKAKKNYSAIHTVPTQQVAGITIKYPNGDRYEGQFIEVPGESLVPSGSGQVSPRPKRAGGGGGRSKGVDKTEAANVRRIKHGLGSYYFSNGDKYCGEWDAGRMHGEGCFHWAVGDVYTGLWERGTINGTGTKHCESDGTVSQGQWCGGCLHGQGERMYGCGDSYSGEHRDDRRHGHGRYTWSGSGYSTATVLGVTVRLTHRAGDVFEGNWRDDCAHGIGQLCREGCPQPSDIPLGPLPLSWTIEAEVCVAYW